MGTALANNLHEALTGDEARSARATMEAKRQREDPWAPHSLEELALWVHRSLDAPEDQKTALLAAVTALVERQRQLWQDSKLEAVHALSTAFADRVAKLRDELVRRDATVANITHYFEEVVAELSEKAHRDPKTRLLNYDWFMERIESFLATDQRARWSALGVIDLTGFKWVNDTLGHAVGDRVISRVARILAEHLRSRDLLAVEYGQPEPVGHRDLHARFGGDEFCFFMPSLSTAEDAHRIAARFKTKLEHYPWRNEHSALAQRPVKVDIGVVCLQLGPLDRRRGATHTLSQELVQRADRLMYRAKQARATDVEVAAVQIEDGHLADLAVPMASPGS